MKAPSKILVSTDFSNASRLALAGARVLASGESPDIIVAHVLSVPELGAGEVEAASSLQRALEENAHQELAKLRDEEFGGADNVKTVLLRDQSVSDALCQLAKTEDVDVIVIATHGRTGLAHMLIGSVAERVVRHAPCPVFTLRSKLKD